MSQPVPRNETKPTPWHSLAADDVLARLRSSPQGLDPTVAAELLIRHGPNQLVAEERPSIIRLALHHINNPVSYVLLAAAAASLLSGNLIDAAAIAVVVVLNTTLGVISEWRAEQALAALERLAAPRARVLRAGQSLLIPATEVVPGDILQLAAGDRVAADARLLWTEELQVDEAALTGESEPVAKNPTPLAVATELADRLNMVWLSTVITGGRGAAVVVATGMKTTLGSIAAQMRATQRPLTPLQQRINNLGTTLGIVAVSLGAVLFALGLLRGYPTGEMLLFAVAAAVSSVPAGLPAAVSVTLALGVRRMAQRNAVIRRLPAVETLGSTTVICTDKTGTLTRNEMTVTRLWVAGNEVSVPVEPVGPVRDLLLAGALASDATIVGPDGRIEGTPTERAILNAIVACGIDIAAARAALPRIAEIPFSSSRKFMAVLVGSDKGRRIYLKGAPERVLNRCRYLAGPDGRRVELTDELCWEIRDTVEQLAANALRVVAAAAQDIAPDTDRLDSENLGSDFVLLGLWGMADPLRPEAQAAVRAAQNAGIRVLMLTGDHVETAAAIGRQAGIVSSRAGVIAGSELDALSDEELVRQLGSVSVFARVTPTHKLRVLNALTRQGEVVAMTGDGVNDAPALKAADIGIAMGGTGTEVAKEAADMVLLDDNFATIVRAIEEGRIIFRNIRRVVTYLVATSLGEMLTFVACIIAGLDKPLTPVMVLWVNLVTDGACTVPLGVEPGHGSALAEPPRSPRERLVNRPMLGRIALLALTMATGTFIQFLLDRQTRPLAHARTIAFTTLAAFQWFQALTMRSTDRSIFTIGLAGNRSLAAGIIVAVSLQLLVMYTPVGPAVFGTVPLGLADWLRIVALAGSILLVDELRKLFSRRRRA